MRLCGGAIMVVCVLIWGSGKAAALYERQRLTKALAIFAAFCGERISTFRDPLDVIFASFENDVLEAVGFITVLRDAGCRAAVEKVAPMLTERDAAFITQFSKKIGGENEVSQSALCTHVAAGLEASSSEQLGELAGKTKMYRLLPALAALSVVILLI